MYDKTIIYYTSNRENPKFEAKIRNNILKQKGNLPIINVSQKPINFGNNICVGDVGHSYLNEFRQILIGAKKAETEYLVFTESDFLYPQNYFSFEPKGANIYRYNNVWILFKNPRLYSYRRKNHSVGAQIGKRDYIIKLLEEHLEGAPEWFDGEIQPKDKNGVYKKDVFTVPFELFGSNIPCVSFKTGQGMRKFTNVLHGRSNLSMKLPYWGHAGNLRKEYF